MVFHANSGGVSAAVVASRVSPCLALSNASIPYVLWGEDSLCFAFNVPTSLFPNVNILVPAGRLSEACAVITARLPYNISPERHHRLPSAYMLAYLPECLRLDIKDIGLSCDHPKHVLLIEDHLVHFDTTDPRCIKQHPLKPFWRVKEGDYINVPTLVAYFDSLLWMKQNLRYLKPVAMSVGWWDWLMGRGQQTPEEQKEVARNRANCLGAHIFVSLSYLSLYTFKKKSRLYPDVDSIAQPIREVAAMLKEENRDVFLQNFVGVDPPRTGYDPWDVLMESSDSEDEDAGAASSDSDSNSDGGGEEAKRENP
jgi:hypothetical protein